MAALSSGDRGNLPKKAFALPASGPGSKPAYPLTDSAGQPSQAHAVSALARVAVNGTPQEKATVRANVRKAFPNLPSSKGKGGSQTAAHNNRVDRRAGKGGS